MDLEVTGTITSATRRAMHKPRCGVRDDYRPLSLHNGESLKQYVFNNTWQKSHITYRYRLLTFEDDMSPTELEKIVDDAFAEWQKHVPLSFENVCEDGEDGEDCEADIDIQFINDSRDIHTDGNRAGSFRIPYMTHEEVAHASSGQNIVNYIHFNKRYHFTASYQTGDRSNNLFAVALHEIGHILGLDHVEENRDSIMFPTYAEPKSREVLLSEFDQRLIKTAYENRYEPATPAITTTTITTTTTTTTTTITTTKTRPTTATTTQPPPDNPKGRAFEDEFNSDGGVDMNKWEFEHGGHGWGNKEEQYYTDNRRENARCENGRLIIEARKENFKSKRFTSAKLKSKQAFLYGRLQIRAKVPSGTGTWSSLYLMPEKHNYGSSLWPDNGEIDLMVHLGHNGGIIGAGISTESDNHGNNNQPWNTVPVSDATTQYKIYTLQWKRDKLEMFVGPDEERAFDKRILFWNKNNKDWRHWPFDKPFRIQMNLAVGGDAGGQHGIDEGAFPQRMEIDWVHFDENY